MGEDISVEERKASMELIIVVTESDNVKVASSVAFGVSPFNMDAADFV